MRQTHGHLTKEGPALSLCSVSLEVNAPYCSRGWPFTKHLRHWVSNRRLGKGSGSLRHRSWGQFPAKEPGFYHFLHRCPLFTSVPGQTSQQASTLSCWPLQWLCTFRQPPPNKIKPMVNSYPAYGHLELLIHFISCSFFTFHCLESRLARSTLIKYLSYFMDLAFRLHWLINSSWSESPSTLTSSYDIWLHILYSGAEQQVSLWNILRKKWRAKPLREAGAWEALWAHTHLEWKFAPPLLSFGISGRSLYHTKLQFFSLWNGDKESYAGLF